MVLILSALSLLFGALAIAACARGQWTPEGLQWQATDEAANTWRGADVVIGASGVYMSWQQYDFEMPGTALLYAQDRDRVSGLGYTSVSRENILYAGESIWSRIGFGLRHDGTVYDTSGEGPYRYRFDSVRVPYWVLILGFACAGIPSLRAVLARRRHSRRVHANQCPECGYDLRASPDRCPECGALANPCSNPHASARRSLTASPRRSQA